MEEILETDKTKGYAILDRTTIKGIIEVKKNGLETEVIGGRIFKKGTSYPTFGEFKEAIQKEARDNYNGAKVSRII
jgi:hypothetical protein